jgi:glycosyltransferase involved in cell wall biosynthesis
MGGDRWTGGSNYLENLISVLSDFPALGVTPLLVAGTSVDEALIRRFARFLPEPVAISPVWDSRLHIRLGRAACTHVLQHDVLAEREYRKLRADVVFQHSAWFGSRFAIPTLAWIADFQHRKRPEMFSTFQRLRRDVGYTALSFGASRIMVSSFDAKADCERFYPRSQGKVDVVRFAVAANEDGSGSSLLEVRQRYALPEKFLFLPNQLWKHKNHLGVIQAIRLLVDSGESVQLVACGNPQDYRHPGHPRHVLAEIDRLGLGECFRYLGMIPKQDVLPLMRLAAAMVNPSFHEGWSTTVEEAKAFGVPMALSNIAIHREQAAGHRAWFFDPERPADMAHALAAAWREAVAGPRKHAECAALLTNNVRRQDFAASFAAAVNAAFHSHDSTRSRFFKSGRT